MSRVPSSRLAAVSFTGALALGLLTGAAPSKPQTQWLSRPAEAARVARVEEGLPGISLPGETPRHLSLPQWMELYKVPGLSLAVFDQGKLVWAKGYGVKQAGGTEPVTIDTLFQAASISKPVTAMAAMHHAEKNKWSLDENVNDKLVSWKLPDNDFTKEQKVTLRRLLSHTAGTTVHGFGGYAVDAPLPTTQQILDGEKPANTSAVRVDTVPGTITRYSGGGTTIVQQFLADQLKKPFPQIMKETVLTPLGMKDSTFEQPLPASLAPRAATGTHPDGKSVQGGWHVYPEMAPAGLWTTPSDLARAALEMSKATKGQSKRVVSQAMAKQMLTRQPESEAFGIGFMRNPGQGWFGHGGANEGYRAVMVAFAESGSGIVVMTNSDNGSRLFERLVASAISVYGWKGYTVEPEHPSVTVDLIVRTKGVEDAVAWFKARKTEAPQDKKLSADILNELGYSLMRGGQQADAVKVFEANVALFPQDANAHDSLGEGYVAAGRKDEGAASYRKSLELNPKNDNARKVLETLGTAATTK
ncbi:serine hydrolase [Myxococcus sp. K38C18041901]|uniref:serine hydrolase n=1 Tax=Myxococcus guangdongensis TaxID=2906760 RepID=UPI0020A6F499|nr:serine hydrolase [Myxococcus guangdongensis]MCP3063484.1 serine hydrolase [Myxococcus guangdongensis]